MTKLLKLKRGVILAGLHIKMTPALKAADKIWESYGQDLVVTGGLDGAHSAGSLHYCGRALDLRIWGFSSLEIIDIAQNLKATLGDDYDVVTHKTHIHVEYDPK